MNPIDEYEMNQSSQDFSDRFCHLLELIWAGHQSRMATDLECARSIVSMVVGGRVPPGRELLAKLSRHPEVNATWLFTGYGEPLASHMRDAGEILEQLIARIAPTIALRAELEVAMKNYLTYSVPTDIVGPRVKPREPLEVWTVVNSIGNIILTTVDERNATTTANSGQGRKVIKLVEEKS